jgi:hypothetical protein
VRTVASRDVTTALEFSRTLAEPLRQQALMATTREWATMDPVAALTWARENGLPLSKKVSAHINTILGTAMERGPEKTTQWIESLPEGPDRDRLVGSALGFAKAGLAPRLFALIPETEQPKYVGPFMLSLNMQTSGSGREWIRTLPEGKLRAAAMENLISYYWFKNPVEIIESFPAGYSRDVAYATHVRKSSRESGAPDVQQLSKIANEDLRQRTAVIAFGTWYRTDRAAARKWMEETPHIPAEWKARMKRAETDQAE